MTCSNLATPKLITETDNLKDSVEPHAWDGLICQTDEKKFITAIYCDMRAKGRNSRARREGRC
jgi:hypothetical protein